MEKVARFSASKAGRVLTVLAFLGAQAAFAASPAATQHKADCKLDEQQVQANLEAQSQADPSIHAARLDTVFYNTKRDACLASVFFTKGTMTYAGIVDISDHQMLWAKSYKGTNFSPTHVLAMDAEMDEAIKGLELDQPASTGSNANDFLPLLFDRTLNTFPAIKNALIDSH